METFRFALPNRLYLLPRIRRRRQQKQQHQQQQEIRHSTETPMTIRYTILLIQLASHSSSTSIDMAEFEQKTPTNTRVKRQEIIITVTLNHRVYA